jgi:ubiquinone biosynthesis protein
LFRAFVGDVSRATRIAGVLAKHGFGELGGIFSGDKGLDSEARAQLRDSGRDRRRTAIRVRDVLQELGPTYVKVGQILSTRSDLLPPEMIEELAKLQDRVNPMPWDQIETVLVRELGSIDEHFERIEQKPLAAASIAQTHRAVLRGGQQVVVKVQRPGLAATIRADLDLMMFFARMLENSFEDMKYYSPAEVVATLDKALNRELNFRFEATELEDFGANFKDDATVVIPRVFRQASTASVLTMEYIQGVRPADMVPDSPESQAAALLMVDAFYRQVFVHGLFHGDPHPGNLFVVGELPNLRIAFIDFGLCGSLSSLQREYLVQLVVAVLSGDIDGISRMLLRMGHPLAPVDTGAFKLEIARIRERYFRKNLNNIDLGAFAREVFEAAQEFRIRIAGEYSVLTKSAVTMEGVIRYLSPRLDLHEHIKPYTLRLVQDFYSPDRIIRGVLSSTVNFANFVREVPEQIGQVLIDLESGHQSMEVKNKGLDRINTELNLQSSRIVLAIICAGLVAAAPMWAGIPDTIRLPWLQWPTGSTLAAVCVILASVLGVSAVLGHLGTVWRLRRRMSLNAMLKLMRGDFR